MTENYKLIEDLAKKDAAGLVEKGKSYGDSWKKRGGVGAFMMLARKWDRIENLCTKYGYDVFKAAADDMGPEGIIDDIEDLRRYLLLVQAHVESEVRVQVSKRDQCKDCGCWPCECVPKWAAPTSATVHGVSPRPVQCPTCGAPGGHAGHVCPRIMEAERARLMQDVKTLGYGNSPEEGGPTISYVDQDGPHDPYGRT